MVILSNEEILPRIQLGIVTQARIPAPEKPRQGICEVSARLGHIVRLISWEKGRKRMRGGGKREEEKRKKPRVFSVFYLQALVSPCGFFVTLKGIKVTFLFPL